MTLYRVVVHVRGERRLLKSGRNLTKDAAEAMKESMAWDWRLALVRTTIEEED